jgi:hypothetical protein
MPALFIASVLSGPGIILRASSKAISAWASRSSLGRSFFSWGIGTNAGFAIRLISSRDVVTADVADVRRRPTPLRRTGRRPRCRFRHDRTCGIQRCDTRSLRARQRCQSLSSALGIRDTADDGSAAALDQAFSSPAQLPHRHDPLKIARLQILSVRSRTETQM